MSAAVIAMIAFAGCFVAGRKSLAAGVCALLSVGYGYGIIRANIPALISHFLFDFAATGLYLSAWTRPLTPMRRFRMRSILPWVVLLAVWPVLVFLYPAQPLMVRLVGLRAAIFFLPFLLIGTLLDADNWYTVAVWLAILNLLAFALAIAEFTFGISHFFPVNAVTRIIYFSKDVSLGRHSSGFRIPSSFSNSASYAAAMVSSVPLLLGGWVQAGRAAWTRHLLLAALGASVIAVFLAASRSQALILIVLATGATCSGLLKGWSLLGWGLIAAAVVYLVLNTPAMQRFTTLGNLHMVRHRVSSSANDEFFDLAVNYPLGNGLGGGGTSMPYFLQQQVQNPVAMENEYARLMLEEGWIGLFLWLTFFCWIMVRPIGRGQDVWLVGRWLARLLCTGYVLTAFIGTGLLTAIPITAELLLFMGWISGRRPVLRLVPLCSPSGRYRTNRIPAIVQ